MNYITMPETAWSTESFIQNTKSITRDEIDGK